MHKTALKNPAAGLIAVGILLIPLGLFSDLAWLKRLGDACAGDGTCEACSVMLNLSRLMLPLLGAILIILILKGFKGREDSFLEPFLSLAIFAFLFLYLFSSQIRYLNNDEYEHLHNAWMMREGTIPYFSLDLKHSPMLEWVNLLLMSVVGESAIILQTVRLFMFLLSCGSLCLVYWIANEAYGSRLAGFAAVFLLLGSFIWMTCSFEARPDNFMVFFALVSLRLLLLYFRTKRFLYLALFACSCVLSLLGKQNAAIFLFAVAVAFIYGIVFDEGHSRKRRIVAILTLLAAAAAALQIEPTRTFLWININRHIIPNDIKFFPFEYLFRIMQTSPAVILLFVTAIFTKPEGGSQTARRYLYSISFACLAALFLMNRPFPQEMILMTATMSIVASNVLVVLIQKVERKHSCLIACLIAVPAMFYFCHVARDRPADSDISVTETILQISNKDDLVFDAYGKAIFRHSPLEPNYLLYFPGKFSRLEILKKSEPKFVIEDEWYYARLPREVHEWIKENYIRTAEHPLILVRKKS